MELLDPAESSQGETETLAYMDVFHKTENWLGGAVVVNGNAKIELPNDSYVSDQSS